MKNKKSLSLDLDAVTLTLENLSFLILSLCYCQPFKNGNKELLSITQGCSILDIWPFAMTLTLECLSMSIHNLY